MDFLAIGVWIFNFLILQLLPLVSLILLAIGVIGLSNRIPGTLSAYARAQGAKLQAAFKKR